MELALLSEGDTIRVTAGIQLEGVFVNAILSSIANDFVVPNLVSASRGGSESSAMFMSKAPIEDERVKKSQAGRSNCPLKSATPAWDEFELRLGGRVSACLLWGSEDVTYIHGVPRLVQRVQIGFV